MTTQYHLININIDDQEAALGPVPPVFKPNWGDTLVYSFLVVFFVSLAGIAFFMPMVPYMTGAKCMMSYARGWQWYFMPGPVAGLPLCDGLFVGLTPFQAAQCCNIVTPGGIFPTPGGTVAILFALCAVVFVVASCILVGAGAVVFTLAAIVYVYEHRVVIVKVIGIALALVSMVVALGYVVALVAVVALRLLN